MQNSSHVVYDSSVQIYICVLMHETMDQRLPEFRRHNYRKPMEESQASLPQEGSKMKAIAAIDGSDESFHALSWFLDTVFKRAVAMDSSLVTLVHVMEPLPHYAFPGGGFAIESATKAQEQDAEKMLSRAFQICKEKNVIAKTLIVEGQPKEKICELGQEMNVDLIVVGSRGLGQIKRAFLGSVSDYCAHNAHCPVLIVKLPKQADKK